MSHNILNGLGVHLNQRTQILEDLLNRTANETSKPQHTEGKTIESSIHSKVSVMLDRFLEICPA